MPVVAHLKDTYENEVCPRLQKEMGYPSPMAVPRIVKVILSMGVGEAINDRKTLDHAIEDMTLISGQKPVATRARKSVAGFKIRTGYPIGCKVTLRRRRMYEFLERLVGIAIPRERDFRGLSPKSFDGFGNYSLGISEQIIFPEIDYDKIDKLRGLNVTIVTSANTDKEGLALLTALNFPFKRQEAT